MKIIITIQGGEEEAIEVSEEPAHVRSAMAGETSTQEPVSFDRAAAMDGGEAPASIVTTERPTTEATARESSRHEDSLPETGSAPYEERPEQNRYSGGAFQTDDLEEEI